MNTKSFFFPLFLTLFILCFLSGLYLAFFTYPSLFVIFREKFMGVPSTYFEVFFHHLHSLTAISFMILFGGVYFLYFLKSGGVYSGSNLIWANIVLLCSSLTVLITFYMGLIMPWNSLIAYKWYSPPISTYFGGKIDEHDHKTYLLTKLMFTYVIHISIPIVGVLSIWPIRKFFGQKIKLLSGKS